MMMATLNKVMHFDKLDTEAKWQFMYNRLLTRKGSEDADIWWNAAWLGFRIFHNRIVIDLDLYNVNMPIESQSRTFYLMILAWLVMFALSATIYEKFEVEICMTLIFTFRIGHGQM